MPCVIYLSRCKLLVECWFNFFMAHGAHASPIKARTQSVLDSERGAREARPVVLSDLHALPRLHALRRPGFPLHALPVPGSQYQVLGFRRQALQGAVRMCMDEVLAHKANSNFWAGYYERLVQTQMLASTVLALGLLATCNEASHSCEDRDSAQGCTSCTCSGGLREVDLLDILRIFAQGIRHVLNHLHTRHASRQIIAWQGSH